MNRPGKRVAAISLISLCLATVTACGGILPTKPTIPPGLNEVELSPGDITLSLTHDDLERTYVLHLPASLDFSQPAAVVFAFHGIGMDASEMARISGLNRQADESGFVVVYPIGTGKYRSWNGGKCCGEAAKNEVDDVGFVRDLVTELSSAFTIDPDQIYITGFSNGAIFAYRAACELSDIIAAVAPVSGLPIIEDLAACAPQRPIPILHFHGTADAAIPYDGGFTQSGFEFVSVNDTLAFWATHDKCDAHPVTDVSGSIRHDIYVECAGGSAVELYTIMDGEHAWPGGEAVNQKMGEPTGEINGSRIIWEFFSAHSMP